jgi:hypothetical protein
MENESTFALHRDALTEAESSIFVMFTYTQVRVSVIPPEVCQKYQDSEGGGGIARPLSDKIKASMRRRNGRNSQQGRRR